MVERETSEFVSWWYQCRRPRLRCSGLASAWDLLKYVSIETTTTETRTDASTTTPLSSTRSKTSAHRSYSLWWSMERNGQTGPPATPEEHVLVHPKSRGIHLTSKTGERCLAMTIREPKASTAYSKLTASGDVTGIAGGQVLTLLDKLEALGSVSSRWYS